MGAYLNPEAFKFQHKVLPKRLPPRLPLFYCDFEHQSDLELFVWPPDCHWAVKNGLLNNEDTTTGGKNIRIRNLLVGNVFIRYKGMVRHGQGNHIYLSKPGTVTGAATGDGYILGFNTTALNRVEIFRADDGTPTLLATADVGTLEDNVLYLLELYYRDGELMVRLFDGKNWYEAKATDTTYKPPFEVGTWCQYDAAYDDLEVYRI